MCYTVGGTLLDGEALGALGTNDVVEPRQVLAGRKINVLLGGWHPAPPGSEMIVWGGDSANSGVVGDGARYDPTANTWTALPTAGAPSPRYLHTAAWTVSELIVWGGQNSTALGDGALLGGL